MSSAGACAPPENNFPKVTESDRIKIVVTQPKPCSRQSGGREQVLTNIPTHKFAIDS